MALFKYFKRVSKKEDDTKYLPMLKEIKKADEEMTKATEAKAKLGRTNYNLYTPRQRAQIGQYAAENGPMKAAIHFSSLWKMNINKSTARWLK